MTVSSLQAAVIAAVTQIISLIVGFGIVNNIVAGSLISASTALVNVGFLVAHSLHANAAAKVTAAKVAVVPAVAVAPVPPKAAARVKPVA